MHGSSIARIFVSSKTRKQLLKLKFTYIMNIEQIKSEIVALALEMNVSFVAACQAMQSASATKGDESLIAVIHKIKMDSLK